MSLAAKIQAGNAKSYNTYIDPRRQVGSGIISTGLGLAGTGLKIAGAVGKFVGVPKPITASVGAAGGLVGAGGKLAKQLGAGGQKVVGLPIVGRPPRPMPKPLPRPGKVYAMSQNGSGRRRRK